MFVCFVIFIAFVVLSQLKAHGKRVKADDLVTLLPTLLNHTDGQISAAGIDLLIALRGVYRSQVRPCHA